MAGRERVCACRCLGCAAAGRHLNHRRNATCCFVPGESGELGLPPTSCDAAAVVDLHVAEPWAGHIAAGRKTVEGRLRRGLYAGLAPGDTIRVNGDALCTVTRVSHYATLEEYLGAEGLAATLPGVTSIEDGVRVYRQFYAEEDERAHGVLAIELARSAHDGSTQLTSTRSER